MRHHERWLMESGGEATFAVRECSLVVGTSPHASCRGTPVCIDLPEAEPRDDGPAYVVIACAVLIALVLAGAWAFARLSWGTP